MIITKRLHLHFKDELGKWNKVVFIQGKENNNKKHIVIFPDGKTLDVTMEEGNRIFESLKLVYETKVVIIKDGK